MRKLIKDKMSKHEWMQDCLKIIRTKNFLIALGIAVAIVVLRLGVNWIFAKENDKVKPIVNVVNPIIRQLDKKLTLPGNVEAIEQANIYSHVAGYLKKIHVDEGDKVKAGQLLAEIDAPDVLQEYRKAKADDDLKVTTRKRYQELVNDKVVSQQEFDTINADANESDARLANAKANLDYTMIRAPFAGSIARRFKYPGDLISVATHGSGSESPIFILVNESKLRVAINVPQSDLSNIVVGNVADIVLNSSTENIFHGEISRIDSLLDESTKTQRVLIDLENEDGSAHAGMFATVTLHFNTTDNALAIPKEALISELVAPTVWKIDNGKLKKVQIDIGIKTNNFVEVTSGLNTNDLVVMKAANPLLVEGLAVDTKVEEVKDQKLVVQ